MLAIGIGYYTQDLKPYEELFDGRAKGSVTLLDLSGAVFAWRGEQFGGIITANTVSPHLKNAIIATEDRRFYQHFGISPRGLASAIRINLRETWPTIGTRRINTNPANRQRMQGNGI